MKVYEYTDNFSAFRYLIRQKKPFSNHTGDSSTVAYLITFKSSLTKLYRNSMSRRILLAWNLVWKRQRVYKTGLDNKNEEKRKPKEKEEIFSTQNVKVPLQAVINEAQSRK